MTNADIIFTQAQRLAEAGKISYTGREFTATLADGSEITVKETEDIHTFNGWKARGFTVRKGEKAIDKFTIWKHSPAKVEELPDESGEYLDRGRMFMKTAAFFAAHQVDPIKS